MFRRLVRNAGWYVDAARLLVTILFGTDHERSAKQAPHRW